MSSLVRKLKSDAVLSNPAVLFNFATTAVGLTRTDPPQLVLSSELANPTRMVQIAMAAKDVPYEDIVFVQYPTEYTSDFINVLPLREPAEQLFAALRANQPLNLTGEASQGSGVDVTGEAVEPTPAPTTDAERCHSRAVRLRRRRDARGPAVGDLRDHRGADHLRPRGAVAGSSRSTVAGMIAGCIRAFARADAWRRRIVRPSAPPC